MQVGMWAWLLHRVTGLVLAVYLLIHVYMMSMSILKGRTLFDDLLTALYTSKLFPIFDLMLFTAVLFHGINGIRLILFDIGIGIRRQKELFWGVIVISAVPFLWASRRVVDMIVK